MTEEVATFGCNQSLVGIVTNPPSTQNKQDLAIIILGAGIVHRVGPNRLNVKIARNLKQLRFTTFRYDFSGVGDSVVRKDNLPYHKSVILETQEAMDYVQAATGIRLFLLLGICSGATNSFEVARKDPRVRGIILINPTGGFDRSARAELAQYFGNRQKVQSMGKEKWFNPKNWWRAITGQIDYTNLKGILGFQARRLLFGQKKMLPHTESAFDNLCGLIHQDVNVQFVISGGDPATKNHFGELLIEKFSQSQFDGKVSIDVVNHADHTFTSLSSQTQLFEVVKKFVLMCSSQTNLRDQIQGEPISEHREDANSLMKNPVPSPRTHEL